jgi:hypothetical protein
MIGKKTVNRLFRLGRPGGKGRIHYEPWQRQAHHEMQKIEFHGGPMK